MDIDKILKRINKTKIEESFGMYYQHENEEQGAEPPKLPDPDEKPKAKEPETPEPEMPEPPKPEMPEEEPDMPEPDMPEEEPETPEKPEEEKPEEEKPEETPEPETPEKPEELEGKKTLSRQDKREIRAWIKNTEMQAIKTQDFINDVIEKGSEPLDKNVVFSYVLKMANRLYNNYLKENFFHPNKSHLTPIKENVSEKTKKKIDQWIEELGTRETALKIIDIIISRVLMGLTSSDLPDTATLANGLDDMESFLNDGDYRYAIDIAKDTVREMLEEEGYDSLIHESKQNTI